MVVCNSYDEEVLENGETRKIMHLPAFLAPYKASILPLSKQLSEFAKGVFNDLIPYLNVNFDETGSIGKRYRRADVVGTPFSITVDDDTINNNTVTVRFRDTMEQEVVKVSDLVDFINKKIEF